MGARRPRQPQVGSSSFGLPVDPTSKGATSLTALCDPHSHMGPVFRRACVWFNALPSLS